MSPLNKLKSGYAFVREDRTGAPLKSTEKIKKNDVIDIYLVDGQIKAGVTDIIKRDAGYMSGGR